MLFSFGAAEKRKTNSESRAHKFRQQIFFERELSHRGRCAFRDDAPRRGRPRALPRARARASAPCSAIQEELAKFDVGVVELVVVDVADSPTTRIRPFFPFFFAQAVFRDCRRSSRHASDSSSNGGRDSPRGPRAGPCGPSPRRRCRPRPEATAAADAVRLDGADQARVRAPRRRGARVDVRVRRDGLRLQPRW